MAQPMIKMLSIDDRMLTTDLDRAGYRSMGVTVRTAANFQVAVDMLKKDHFDLIVINYDYQQVNAPEVCRHFKNDSNYKDTPIVITSVQSNADTRNKSINAGADLFVEQPLPRQYFIEKLKKLLEQSTRADDRVEFQGEAEINLKEGNLKFPIGDLSATGLLLATDREFKPGHSFTMSFEIPGYKKPIIVDGEVVRIIKNVEGNPDRIPGVGVRFVTFNGDSQKRLEKYVEKTADKDARMAYYL